MEDSAAFDRKMVINGVKTGTELYDNLQQCCNQYTQPLKLIIIFFSISPNLYGNDTGCIALNTCH